jgi:hypothetical protein
MMSKLSSYESLLEFNSQFKQGLKYVLVPQAPKTGTRPSNYYDGTIPESLDAPIPNSAMDYTSVATFVPSADTSNSHNNNMLGNIELPQINVEMPNLSIQMPSTTSTTDALNAMGHDLDQLLHTTAQTLVVNSNKLDAMGKDVDRVLQAARSIVSSSVEIASNMPLLEVASKANTELTNVATVANAKIVDPVVDRTVAQIKYAITHPPDYTGYTFTGGAPPGQGLATPFLDAISSALETARETPPLYFADPLPDDYTTIAFGFQAKNTAIETALKVQTSIYDTAQQIAANNAVVQEQVKKLVAHDLEQMQVRNSLIIEKVGERSQSNVQYMHQSQDAITQWIVENTQAIRNRIHVSDWVSNLEQTNFKNLPTNNIFKSEQFNKIIATLKLEEYGGWYIGAILGIILVQIAQNEKESAIRMATEQLTIDTQKQLEQANIEKQRLEGMVVELTEAVSILTEELRTLKTQRVQTDTVLASVQKDVKSVINEQLIETRKQNDVLRNQLESTKIELQTLKDGSVSTLWCLI